MDHAEIQKVEQDLPTKRNILAPKKPKTNANNVMLLICSCGFTSFSTFIGSGNFVFSDW